jgi:hypothetical protein
MFSNAKLLFLDSLTCALRAQVNITQEFNTQLICYVSKKFFFSGKTYFDFGLSCDMLSTS